MNTIATEEGSHCSGKKVDLQLRRAFFYKLFSSSLPEERIVFYRHLYLISIRSLVFHRPVLWAVIHYQCLSFYDSYFIESIGTRSISNLVLLTTLHHHNPLANIPAWTVHHWIPLSIATAWTVQNHLVMTNKSEGLYRHP